MAGVTLNLGDIVRDRTSTAQPKVAYIMSRFPKLTETFIHFEMLALESQGMNVEIYPLLRARETNIKVEGASLPAKILALLSPRKSEVVMHPEVVPLVDRAHYFSFLSWDILVSQVWFMLSRPLVYIGTLATVIRANLGSPNYLFGALSIFPKVVHAARDMQAKGITHVHAHFANHPAAAAFIIHRLVDIPYSFTAHGADFQVDQHMLCEKVREAKFVVAISRYNKEYVVRHCGEETRAKVKVLHCGVDTTVFEPKACPGNSAEPFKIVCTGTLYEVKGQKFLIEACRLLKERGVDFVCELIGSGPYLETLRRQVCESGLTERVRFLGQKNRTEIAELLQRADCVVAPSIPTDSGRREGIPVVIMEAMASGIPVVASRISGIPELITDKKDGLLVPPKNPPSIADSLERLYQDAELRRRLGCEARQTILRDFDLVVNAKKLAQKFSRGLAI